MMNNEKIVYVKAYTKTDGTHVKDHYRGIHTSNGIAPGPIPDEESTPPDTLVVDNPIDKVIDFLTGKNTGEKREPLPMNMTSNVVLTGGVSTTNLDFSNILSAVVSVASIAVGVGITAAKVAAKLYKAGLIGNTEEKARLKPQLNNEIEKIKQTQSIAEKIEKVNLDKLVNAKNQQEYSELYKTLTAQRDLNRQNRLAVNRLEHAAQNEDYETVINELNNYQSNYQNAETSRAISNMPSMDVNRQVPAPAEKPKYANWKEFRRTGFHNHPTGQKNTISVGMKYYDIMEKANDANALWKASADTFKNSAKYIHENGRLLSSTKQLPPDLKSFVSEKLNQQIGKVDSKGIIYKPESKFSQEIVHSPEFKEFLQENFSKLINGEVVHGSTYFGSSDNLKLALGHADIRNMHIDAHGYLNAYVIDTYDFNADDPDWKVEWARNVQEHRLIENLYTINILRIPKEVWTQIIIS